MVFTLRLFGTFSLYDNAGEPVSLRTQKMRALLAYLVTRSGEQCARQRLMDLLWSDRPLRQAQQSLNNALMALRKLGNYEDASLIDSDRQFVRLNNAVIDCDVTTFRRHFKNEPAKAAAVYQGQFLEGLTVPDPQFEEWLRAERSAFHAQACDALWRSAQTKLTKAELDAAIIALRRLTELEPVHEEAHRCLMQLLFQKGDRTGALRQYEVCVEGLKRELQVEPDSATEALVAEIRKGQERAATAAVGQPSQPLSGPPSIAVLPFKSFSKLADHTHIADGITEDIITDLSRFRSLRVTSRNAAFTYKGKSVDSNTVADELGVRYILEGSVRVTEQRMRISAHLIDAQSDGHIWADRFDRDLGDLFETQDDLTNRIVALIAPEVDRAERNRTRRTPPKDFDSWERYHRGMAILHGAGDDQSIVEAIDWFDQVNERDPAFARGFAMAAMTRLRLMYRFEYTQGFDEQRLQNLGCEILDRAKRAIELDRHDAVCIGIYGLAESFAGNHDIAVAKSRDAVACNPNDAWAHLNLAIVLHRADHPIDEILDHIDISLAMSPRDPAVPRRLTQRSVVLFNAERYAEALDNARIASAGPYPSTGALPIIAAALSALGKSSEARAALDEYLKVSPGMTVALFRQKPWLGSPGSMERFLDALSNAGLPE